MTKESDYMLLKRNVIIHLLSLGVLCIGFLLFRFFFNGKITPICTAFAYIIGFSIGVLFQEDGIDAGGTATNNLWIIWSVVFVFIILGGIIFDKFVSPFKKKSE